MPEKLKTAVLNLHLLKNNLNQLNQNAMKRITSIIVGTYIIFNLYSQDFSKGYKALEKSDYAKAKEFFDKNLITKKDNPAICFGLMVIYADKNSPYYNIIEAWNMGKITEKNINSLSVEEKETVAEYFTNTEVRKTSWPVNKKMQQAIGAVESNLIKYIREENNLELANEIIQKFPDYRYYQNVVHIRNQLEFRKYEKLNTLQGYLDFIKKFPDAAQIEKAVRHRDRLALEKAKSINTVEAFETYLKEYPKSAEFNTAVKQRNAVAFNLAKQKNTIEAFEKFINSYPEALEVADAKKIQKQLLYEYAKKIQSLEAYNEFIKKYPDGSHYIDIFNLKSGDLGKKTLSSGSFAYNNVAWARSFDNKSFPETAGGIVVTSANQYIIAGNTIQSDSIYDDAWIIKTDADGKMIWNKIIGGIYHDSVFSVAINNNQELVMLGYTWLGNDSDSKEPWIFMIDADGRKMWNRSLGKWNVTSLCTNSDNDIILGGYEKNDSLENHYKIMVINNSGKKLWSRTYTSPGEINSLNIDFEDNILVAGSKWCFRLNQKGYLLWENQFNVNDSITCAANLVDGSSFIAGVKDSVTFVLARIAKNGNLVWKKEIGNPDGIVPEKIIQLSDGKIFAKGKMTDGNAIILFNQDGLLINTIPSPTGSLIHDFIVDKQGNLVVQYSYNDNIFVIRSSGI